MNKIFEHYGKAFLSGTVFLLVMILVFHNVKDNNGNKGIFKIIGANLKTESIDYKSYTDFDTYASESMKAHPEIKYDYTGMIFATEEIPLTDFIKATEYTGGTLNIRMLNITDQNEIEVTSCYNADTGKIIFPTAGEYKLTMAVKDSASKRYTCTIRVPVNKRG